MEAKGITINIYTGSQVPIGEVIPEVTPKAATVKPSPEKKVDKDVERGAALDVELLTRDSMADDERMELEQRVVLFVREMLVAKKSEVVRDFLSKAKHHLTPELKESISDEIQEVKKGL